MDWMETQFIIIDTVSFFGDYFSNHDIGWLNQI